MLNGVLFFLSYRLPSFLLLDVQATSMGKNRSSPGESLSNDEGFCLVDEIPGCGIIVRVYRRLRRAFSTESLAKTF